MILFENGFSYNCHLSDDKWSNASMSLGSLKQIHYHIGQYGCGDSEASLHSIPMLHPMGRLIIHSERYSRVRATSTSKPSINHKLVLCMQVGNATKINGRRTYVYGYTNILERNNQHKSLWHWNLNVLAKKFKTLRPRRNWKNFTDDILKPIFFDENVWISTNISLTFVSKGPINNSPPLVEMMAWRRPGDQPLSEPVIVYRRIYASLGSNELITCPPMPWLLT